MYFSDIDRISAFKQVEKLLQNGWSKDQVSE
jgi:hypothetical protein